VSTTSNGEAQPGGGAAFWAALGVRIEPEPEPEPEPDLGSEPSQDAETAARADVETETGAGAAVETEDEIGAPVETGTEAGAEETAVADFVAEEAGEEPRQPAAEEPPFGKIVIPAQAQASIDDVEPQEGDVVDGLAVLNETLAESRRARENAPRPEPAWQLAGELSGALPPLKTCLEAILMVVDEPVTDVVLAQVVERPKGEVAEALRELAEEYTAQSRGFELREVGIGDGAAAGATGWRIYSRPQCAPVVERFVRDGQQAKLTQAALETLAVVAYRQPVSRSKVSAIRGVNCDGVMRTLLARGLVEECGTEHETGALLYQTTGYFLERMGLKSLDELPDLAPLLPTAAEIEEEA
jgi:segregation and condensation protein B